MNFNELFKFQAYINLDKREDRNFLAQQEFKKLGISPFRRSGVIPEIENPWWRGSAGCMISHYSILMAASLLDTNVFIFEDDILFIDGTKEIIDSACNELNDLEWDMFYISSNIMQPFKQVSKYLAKMESGQSTVAYGVNKSFLQKLLSHIHLDKIDRPIDLIYSQLVIPNNNCYITVPMCGIQRDSFSDIEGTNVNYSSYLEKRYNENLIKF
jgi:GR25 family glycosyltransferase involved in LPS biosynthesis